MINKRNGRGLFMTNIEKYKKINPKYTAIVLVLFFIVGFIVMDIVDTVSADKDFVSESNQIFNEMNDDVDGGIDVRNQEIFDKSQAYLDKYQYSKFNSKEKKLYDNMHELVYFYRKMFDDKRDTGQYSQDTLFTYTSIESKTKKSSLIK